MENGERLNICNCISTLLSFIGNHNVPVVFITTCTFSKLKTYTMSSFLSKINVFYNFCILIIRFLKLLNTKVHHIDKNHMSVGNTSVTLCWF